MAEVYARTTRSVNRRKAVCFLFFTWDPWLAALPRAVWPGTRV